MLLWGSTFIRGLPGAAGRPGLLPAGGWSAFELEWLEEVLERVDRIVLHVFLATVVCHRALSWCRASRYSATDQAMSEAIPLAAKVLTAEPWSSADVIGGMLLLVGSVALIIGLLLRVGGRR